LKRNRKPFFSRIGKENPQEVAKFTIKMGSKIVFCFFLFKLCLPFFLFASLYFSSSSRSPPPPRFHHLVPCVYFCAIFFLSKKKDCLYVNRICISRIYVYLCIWQACLEQITYFSPIFIVAILARRQR